MHFSALFFVLLSIIINVVNRFHHTFLKLILKVVPVLSLTAVFNFFSRISDNLTFTLLYSTTYINYKTFVVPFENCKMVSFDFSRMSKTFVAVVAFSVNVICSIALESASKAFCLLKSTAINLYFLLK